MALRATPGSPRALPVCLQTTADAKKQSGQRKRHLSYARESWRIKPPGPQHARKVPSSSERQLSLRWGQPALSWTLEATVDLIIYLSLLIYPSVTHNLLHYPHLFSRGVHLCLASVLTNCFSLGSPTCCCAMSLGINFVPAFTVFASMINAFFTGEKDPGKK